MYNEVIELVDIKPDPSQFDEYGDPLLVESKKVVFCDVRSVGMSEFYQAQTLFYKPEIKFVIADYLDFNNEQFVDYNGTRYKILRTYRNGHELEITCYDGVR